LKDIQQLPAILQHSKPIFTLYIWALSNFSGTTILSISNKRIKIIGFIGGIGKKKSARQGGRAGERITKRGGILIPYYR
jgi:hypothetical protein